MLSKVAERGAQSAIKSLPSGVFGTLQGTGFEADVTKINMGEAAGVVGVNNHEHVDGEDNNNDKVESETDDKLQPMEHDDVVYTPLQSPSLFLAPSTGDIKLEPLSLGQLSSTSDANLLTGFSSALVALALMQISTSTFNKVTPSITEYTNSSKLSPQVLEYQDLSPSSKREFSRRKIIEEILETEESYISSLRILSGFYLAMLIEKGNNGVPLRLTHDYVDILIQSHESFRDQLQHLYSLSSRNSFIDYFPSISEEFDSKTKSLCSRSSPMMAALVAELISKRLISVYIYQEYNSIYDLVLKLMQSKEDDPDIGKTLTMGYQNFLETSGTIGMRMDLSFVSLISKPISRISKYKLFLETLKKMTPIEDDQMAHRSIQDSIIQTEYCLMEVNRYGLQEKNMAKKLFESLVFPSNLLQFPVEYLGFPVLKGALYSAWVGKDSQIQCQLLGVFLFKTHIILANVVRPNRYEVKFLIPLSVSKIVESNDPHGGIHTNYEYCFKLVFEHKYQLFELLLLSTDSHESTVWREKLHIMTDFINGPYQFDYSSSKFNEEQGTHSSCIIPSPFRAFDTKLDKVMRPFITTTSTGSIRRHLHRRYLESDYSNIGANDNCYFCQVFPIDVELICDAVIDNALNYASNNYPKSPHKPPVIHLKDLDKSRIENQLEDIWSDELVSNGFLSRRAKSTPSRAHSRTKRSSAREFGQTTPKDEDLHAQLNKDTTKKRVSLMRKTSIVFGDALKSILAGSKY